MTLKEQKEKCLSLIEEYAPDSKVLVDDDDIELKLNAIINQVGMELMKFKKIPAKKQIEVEENNLTYDLRNLEGFYKLDRIIGLKYDLFGYEANFSEYGDATIYYYKIPKQVKVYTNSEEDKVLSEQQDNEFVFDLSDDLLEIMPYGVAYDVLKNDMISNYGSYFGQRYNELKQMIDDRVTSYIGEFEGGLDV